MLKPNPTLAKKIIKFTNNSNDLITTNQLKKKFADLRNLRKPFFLYADELDEIVMWKLDSQYYRSKEQRSVNIDSVVVPITQSCFSISSSNQDYEIELKLKQLTTLKGIAIPLASAILAVCYPDKFVVIDSVLWWEIYGVEKSSFSINDYLNFLLFFEELASYTKLDLQTTEHLLWISFQKPIKA